MDQKLFEQILTEVAEWHRAEHIGSSKNSNYFEGCGGEVPTYIRITKFKPQPCPYQADQKDCWWKISKKQYKGCKPVTVKKCETCGALMTPKGRYIAKPDGFNYPKIIRDADQEE